MENEVAKIERKLIDWEKVLQSWLHSRKAVLLLVTFILSVVAFFLHYLNGDQWIGLIKWLVPSYMGANAVDGFADALKGKGDGNKQ